jgi:hypothetical protein
MTFLSALAAFYTYDRMSGKTSGKRAAWAALAGAGVVIVESLIAAGISAAYFSKYGEPIPNMQVSGLSPDHYPGALPSHGGVPKNVYNRMPSIPNMVDAFGQY